MEEVVLEGLKSRLMAPELVEEFISAFHQELNRKHAADDTRRAADEQKLGRATKTLRGLYSAIADGLRSPGLQQELLTFESRQAELEASIAAAPPSPPRFHSRLADVYREQVGDLHRALSDPQARTEAAEILRGLIDRITVNGDSQGHVVGLTGDIFKLLALPGSKVPASFESSVKVVAGTCFDRDLKCQC